MVELKHGYMRGTAEGLAYQPCVVTQYGATGNAEGMVKSASKGTIRRKDGLRKSNPQRLYAMCTL